MAVINRLDYLSLQADIASARDTVVSAKDDLFNAVYTVVMLQVIIPEVDLLSPFWGTYQSNSGSLDSTTWLTDAVRALQSHVVNRTAYTTVNEYLYNEIMPDKVEASFKEISDRIGYPVDSSYAFSS